MSKGLQKKHPDELSECFKSKLVEPATLYPSDPGFLSLNDVWSSSDGVNWNQVTSSPNWVDRAGHSSVVFDNKMWLLGGRTNANGEENDVWSSTDGLNWSVVTLGAQWSKRNQHSSGVLCGKIWVVGGINANPGGNIDVWSSVDGIDWVQATADAGWAPFKSNNSFVVFDEKLWVLGGLGENDVWFSEPKCLPQWALSTPAAPWIERRQHTSVVFNNKMWIIGGQANTQFFNDVWSSPDGTNWILEGIGGWYPRSGHASVVFNGKIWVMGGSGPGGNQENNEIWSSSDGISWIQHPNAAWSPRQDPTIINYNGELWLFAGADWTFTPGSVCNNGSFSTGFNDVWNSNDGVTWTLITGSAPWGRRTLQTAFVFDSKMWILGGYDGSLVAFDDAWSSTDGINWVNQTNDPFVPIYGHASAVVPSQPDCPTKSFLLGGRELVVELVFLKF